MRHHDHATETNDAAATAAATAEQTTDEPAATAAAPTEQTTDEPAATAKHQCSEWNADKFCVSCGLLPWDGNPAPGSTPPGPDEPAQRINDEAQAEPETPPAGFRHFRHWTNRRILNLGGSVQLMHGGELREVQELTPAGEIRLRIEPLNDGDEASFSNVPFDDRFIGRLLQQLITIE